MMDEFGIIDLVYDCVESTGAGLLIYKDNSPDGEKNSHIVINHLEFHEMEYVNVLPVNVLIFIKENANGMPVRQEMKDVKRKVNEKLKAITTENGQYRNSEISGAIPLPGMKDGFSCINIKVLIKTDKI